MSATMLSSERNVSISFRTESQKRVMETSRCRNLGTCAWDIAGTEFFFPLKKVEKLAGKCPVFAQVTEGVEELLRMEKVETYPNPYEPVEINVPRTPEIIVSVEIETFGESYPEPDKFFPEQIPGNWPVFISQV